VLVAPCSTAAAAGPVACCRAHPARSLTACRDLHLRGHSHEVPLQRIHPLLQHCNQLHCAPSAPTAARPPLVTVHCPAPLYSAAACAHSNLPPPRTYPGTGNRFGTSCQLPAPPCPHAQVTRKSTPPPRPPSTPSPQCSPAWQAWTWATSSSRGSPRWCRWGLPHSPASRASTRCHFLRSCYATGACMPPPTCCAVCSVDAPPLASEQVLAACCALHAHVLLRLVIREERAAHRPSALHHDGARVRFKPRHTTFWMLHLSCTSSSSSRAPAAAAATLCLPATDPPAAPTSLGAACGRQAHSPQHARPTPARPSARLSDRPRLLSKFLDGIMATPAFEPVAHRAVQGNVSICRRSKRWCADPPPLQAEIPSIRTLVTLSPAPNFRSWLHTRLLRAPAAAAAAAAPPPSSSSPPPAAAAAAAEASGGVAPLVSAHSAAALVALAAAVLPAPETSGAGMEGLPGGQAALLQLLEGDRWGAQRLAAPFTNVPLVWFTQLFGPLTAPPSCPPSPFIVSSAANVCFLA
jgi:hypothetical protein